MTDAVIFPGLGTVINAAAIIVGGLIGALAGNHIPKRFQDMLMTSTSVCVLFVGIAGCMEKMLVIHENGGLGTQGSLMLICSFVIGSVTGELINFDALFQRLGSWLKRKTGSENDGGFVGGFVNASVTVCIGAMAIVGSIQDGIYGDISTLTAKALLDCIIIMIMTASMGKGCIFSALPVAVCQGAMTALARVIEPIMTDAALNNISLTGSVLIFCVGINLLFDKKIRVANMLPTIVVAAVWALI